MGSSKVQIVITDQLPPAVPCICDVAPGFVHMLIRAGMTQHETAQTFGDVLAKMIELFPTSGTAT